MRLIDAETVKAYLKRVIFGADTKIDSWVDAMPGADAEPVRHGAWKSVKALGGDNYPYWNSRCSECGYTTKMVEAGWVYCPHCGAKMDEEGGLIHGMRKDD